MGILSAIPVIGKVIDKGLDVVDQFITDKDQANKLKAEIKKQIEAQTHEKDIEELKAQASIVKAEVQGESWLQRNWRPLMMMIFVLIVANNYLIFPYASMWTDKVTVLNFPSAFWGLLTVGIGGYVGSKTMERIKGVRPEQKQK